MAAVVSLPIYADFGHFAYWPATQPSVSKNIYCLKTDWLLSSKVTNKMSKIRKLKCVIETGFGINVIQVFFTRWPAAMA